MNRVYDDYLNIMYDYRINDNSHKYSSYIVGFNKFSVVASNVWIEDQC